MDDDADMKSYVDASDFQHTNFSSANLTGASFISANLTGASFISANLTGVNMNDVKIAYSTNHPESSTNFTGADLSDINCQKFKCLYDAISLELDSKEFSTQFIEQYSLFNTQDLGKPFPNFDKKLMEKTSGEKAFMIFQHALENPESGVAKVLETILNDMADERKAKLEKITSDDSTIDISKLARFVNERGGLSETQICDVIRHMKVEDGTTSTLFQHESLNTKIPLVLHKKNNHFVVNVAKVLNFSHAGFPVAIDADHFRYLINSMVNKTSTELRDNKIGCIQIPIVIEEQESRYYVQLQIYKKNDHTIGARIIDSTNNPIAISTSQVKKLLGKTKKNVASPSGLEKTKENVASLLGVDAINCNVAVSTIHMGVSFGDKRCGMDVLLGMEETTNNVLNHGPEFLKTDKTAKRVVDSTVLQMPLEQYLQTHVNEKAISHTSESRRNALKTYLEQLPNDNLIKTVTTALENYLDAQGQGGFGFWQTSTNETVKDVKKKQYDLENAIDKPAMAAKIAFDILPNGLHNDLMVVTDSHSPLGFLLCAMKSQGLLGKHVKISKTNKLDNLFPSMPKKTYTQTPTTPKLR